MTPRVGFGGARLAARRASGNNRRCMRHAASIGHDDFLFTGASRLRDDERSGPASRYGRPIRCHSTALAASKPSGGHRPMPMTSLCDARDRGCCRCRQQQPHLAPFAPDRPIRRSSSSTSFTSTVTEQISSVLPPTPEFVVNATLWGATGLLLTNFHAHLHLPYWACISLTNVCIRSSMIPIAIRGAKTQVKFGSVSPEVQYIITGFSNDMKSLGTAGRFSREGSFQAMQVWAGKGRLINATMRSLRGIFKLKGVNLMDIFKSPALQIPVFWYFAVDLRKIIEGSDPALAQQLVDSSFFWITDLTEPDPWYGLPIAAGALLYLNVEIAVGRKALSGETSSKSNLQMILKDGFQTLAIFMPCFLAQQPSGVQLYLATSMVFTLLQGSALRNDAIRQRIGLPPTNAKPTPMLEGEYVKDFMAKMAERQAARARGGYILGEGVHVTGAQISVPRRGRKRESTIVVEEQENDEEVDESKMIKIELPDHTLQSPLLVIPDMYKTTPTPFLPGMSEPEFYTPHGGTATVEASGDERLSMPDIPESVMEAANRGEMPERPAEIAPREVLEKRKESLRKSAEPIEAQKLRSKLKNRKKGKRGKR